MKQIIVLWMVLLAQAVALSILWKKHHALEPAVRSLGSSESVTIVGEGQPNRTMSRIDYLDKQMFEAQVDIAGIKKQMAPMESMSQMVDALESYTVKHDEDGAFIIDYLEAQGRFDEADKWQEAKWTVEGKPEAMRKLLRAARSELRNTRAKSK